MEELANLRSLFFSKPGSFLGNAGAKKEDDKGEDRHVLSQAVAFDPAFPGDEEYVENVLWVEKKVVFVTVNLPV